MPTPASPPRPPPVRRDEDLVRECLRGDEQAWADLVDKYKQLVYSIPRKYGAGLEDAADIFQAVWADLHSELPRLRNPGALRAWLIQVTAHHCFRWKRRWAHETRVRDGEADIEDLPGEVVSPRLVEDVEREQILREATASLSPRCQEMIRLLFYEHPPRPYAQVAQQLGLAVGSIGFIRGRCLNRLKRELEARGF